MAGGEGKIKSRSKSKSMSKSMKKEIEVGFMQAVGSHFVVNLANH